MELYLGSVNGVSESESRSVMSDFLRPPWTIESMEFSRPGYQSLPNPGIEPRSPTLQADSLPAEPPGKPKNTGVGRRRA